MRSSKTHLCTQVNFLYNLPPDSRARHNHVQIPWVSPIQVDGILHGTFFPPENNFRLKQKLTHLNLYTYPSREIRSDSCVCYYKVNDKYKGVLNGFYC